MKTGMMVSIALGAAMLGGTLTVATSGTGAIASSAAEAAAKRAARSAALAERALGKRRGAEAVRHAEAAVAMVPGDAAYRALLGRSYLAAGRFVAASQAFTDTLSIDPADGRSALNLALAQTAQGDWTAARATLATHATRIAPADRGLALALAGDPEGGVALLGLAARDPAATPTVRQNYALALALSGRWAEARAIAAVDVSPADLDRRIVEWASFVRPAAASDQVASLLGVTSVSDAAQPVSLALTQAPVAVALAEPVGPTVPAPVVADERLDMVAIEQVPAPVVMASSVTFLPRREIVQALPVVVAARDIPAMRHAATAALVRSAASAPRPMAPGNYVVQLGAFENSGVARDAWRRAVRGTPQLASLTPGGAQATVGGETYYRLSVGGFARQDAQALCGKLRSRGSRCFVRAQAGDAVANWARGDAGRIAVSRHRKVVTFRRGGVSRA